MTDMNQCSETEIRTNYIDPKLRQAGWDFDRHIRQEYTFSNGRINLKENKRGKKKQADYVLFYYPNKPIAVIEAKKATLSASDGMQQAIDYAQRLNVPFMFSTNGREFVFRNEYAADGGRETRLSMDEFPSPEKLWQMYLEKNPVSENQLKVIQEPYYTDNPQKMPRYYQLNAINQTVERIASGEQRAMLVMATGTGKTYVAFQIIWRLWKAGIKKRILFLADRRALIDQTAANDFSPFGDKMMILSRKNFDTAHEIYLALYQGLSTDEAGKETDETDDEAQFLFNRFSPDFFDLVIIDECHRGSAREDSKWRKILEYFSSAAQIGLTATPKEAKDVSNIDYFGDPIYTYTLKQGIDDGYLAPYRVIRVIFDKDIEGYIPYDGETDDKGQAFKKSAYDALDYDKTLVLEKRTKLVAKTVSDYLKQNNCRMDKAIFFCVDQEHAGRMREALINENADLDKKYGHYVVRMTANDEEGVKLLDKFRDVESEYPVLVTTSKLLTTGIDIQTIKYIVLDANISSMTEFKQIIGRGTRIWEDPLNEEKNKLYFTIFDFRYVTQKFYDPDFDGPIEQAEEYNPKKGTAAPPPKKKKDGEHQQKLYLADADVNVSYTTMHYLRTDGQLTMEEAAKNTILNKYSTLRDFITEWKAEEHKTAIIQELEKSGVSFPDLASKMGNDYDPFDMICYLAFGQQLTLTRKERANRVRKQNYFAKYGETAAKILDEILTKYSESGIENLEKIDVLGLDPISQYGSILEIIQIFGGKEKYDQAISELKHNIYAV